MKSQFCKALVYVGFFSLVVLLGCRAGALATGAPVASTQVYWGAYINGVPWDMTKLTAFEQQAGKGVSIVHWGQPWWHCYSVCGYQSFDAQRAQFQAVRDYGAIPLVDWGSWDYAAKPLEKQPNFALSTIIQGKHDQYIREWATQAKAWGQPFFLRFDWEMNGRWYPWSQVQNGNRAGEYVRAWRRVRDIFTEVGATNVTWVWSPAVEYPGSFSLDALYPGDAYVDWVAMDGFNWAGDRQTPWRSLQDVFLPTYQELVKIAPTKPIMIAEIASTENTSGQPQFSKARWIEDGFAALPRDLPRVKAVVWFNWNDGNPSLTWPLESSRDSMAAFRRAIGSSVYTGAAYAKLGPGIVAPPGGFPILEQ